MVVNVSTFFILCAFDIGHVTVGHVRVVAISILSPSPFLE